MGHENPAPSRQSLQEIFALASARRGERRRFIATLRLIFERRLKEWPALILKEDRRMVPREQ